MKSQINQLGKSIYSRTGKTLIIAVALFGFNQMGASTFKSIHNPQGDSPKSDSLTGPKPFSPVEDQAVFNPSMVFTAVNERAIDQMIAEDNKIIESNPTNDGSLLYIEKSVEDIIKDDNKIIEAPEAAQIRPLYLDRTMEDKIAEDNAIIEGNSIEVRPLDMEVINKRPINLKKGNALLIGMN